MSESLYSISHWATQNDLGYISGMSSIAAMSVEMLAATIMKFAHELAESDVKAGNNPVSLDKSN